MAEAGRTVLRAIVALPRQIAAVWRAAAGGKMRGAMPSPQGRFPSIGRALIGLLIALVANLAALVIAFTIARALYYPFWAAGTSRAALERSWGGPSAVGATLAHWLVAAVTIVVAYGLLRAVDRLGQRWSGTGTPG
jgi:hypothetical protein